MVVKHQTRVHCKQYMHDIPHTNPITESNAAKIRWNYAMEVVLTLHEPKQRNRVMKGLFACHNMVCVLYLTIADTVFCCAKPHILLEWNNTIMANSCGKMMYVL